jgi:hypothetical protein
MGFLLMDFSRKVLSERNITNFREYRNEKLSKNFIQI